MVEWDEIKKDKEKNRWRNCNLCMNEKLKILEIKNVNR